jgi:putative ABC transport system permease protein
MMLFRLVSWPYLRQHALRTALTLGGIVLGASVFVAMRAANASVLGSFRQTLLQIAGATELQVTAGATGFDEEVLERVQALAEVGTAAPIVEAVAATGLPGQGNLLILGVDMTGDRSLREYTLESGDAAVVDDPLVFLAQPDSIMITDAFARRNGLGADSHFALETVEGRKSFVVRGILKSGGVSSAFGGNIAIMDIYATQHVFGRGRRFDRIDLALAPGVPLEGGREAVQRALGPGFQVQTPASRGQSFDSLLRIYRLMLRLSSSAALVVGMFIIYNSFAVAVTLRRKEIGILRALGATRRQIGLLFLGESAVGGLVGSTLGVVAGYLLAGLVAARVAKFLEGLAGVNQGDVSVRIEPSLVVLSIAIGTITSMVAAAFPARSAIRVDPVKALQRGREQVLGAGNSRSRLIAAAAAIVAGAALVIGTSTRAPFYVGYLLVVLAALLLTPILSIWLVRALRPLLLAWRPVEGALAIDSLLSAPRRTSATVAALMLAIALVIGLGGTARAARHNISEYAEHALNADFFVTPSPTLTGRDYRFPDSMTNELATVEGVREVQRMRQPRISYGAGRLLVVATDVARLGATSPRTALEGDPSGMIRLTAAGQGLIGSENFGTLNHHSVGDLIELMTPAGPLRLPLVGIVRDYGDQEGAVMIDLSVYRRYWQDDTLDFFRVFLRPGADPAAVRDAILRRFSTNRRVFLLSTSEVREYVDGLTGQWFGMTRVQVVIAILVAVLGIVNSLAIAIMDRRRELGILQAVGGLRWQVRSAIWMEALCIALVGVVLGLALGAVHLYCLLQITYRDYPGLRFDYMYPATLAVLLFPLLLSTAFAAAIGPAESSVRGSLVEAIAYE